VARLPLHRWRYSTRILYSGCDQSAYQQDLIIHRTAGRDHEEVSGGLKVWHIYLGPQCRADYGDIRFTNSTGAELAYYLWPDYDATSARFTVRLEGADAAGELLVWYGNPSAATTSDGDATALFFDDFDAYDSSAWTKTGSGVTYADSIVTLTASSASPQNRLVSNTAWSQNNETIIQTRARVNTVGGLGGELELGGYLDDNNMISAVFCHRISAYSDKFLNFAGAIHKVPLSGVSVDTWQTYTLSRPGKSVWRVDENTPVEVSPLYPTGDLKIRFRADRNNVNGYQIQVDYVLVRAYSAAPPSILRTSRGVSPAYAGLARLTGGAAADDGVIRFAGVGSILVVDDEGETIAGAGSFAIETSVRSQIPIAGAAGLTTGFNLAPAPATPTGAGGVISEPARLHTPLGIEAGEGSAYVAPAPVQFDVWQYRFESLTISRSAQDALWRCEGRIVGLDAPLAYKQFEVRVPDHNGVLRTLFVGFVPGRDYVRAVTADESVIQGYDAGFYLTRQYLPDGDLNYPKEFAWGPMSLLRYWLGEETTTAGSRSRWEQVTGIYPYRLSNPHSYYEWPYDKRIDWNFMPKTTKAQAIQEVCEKSGLVFLVKWRKINGVWRPCAYLVPEEDIDHYSWGLDLPGPVTFTHPDPHVIDGVRVTMRSDEKYNRIVVRSAAPSGAWFEAIRETPGLRYGDELPIEYLEERGDLPDEADHGGWCNMRADDLYDYYTKYAYTYTLTLIDRVDLELYQRCQFFGFGSIPNGEMMRIIAISYRILPTHSEVEITVTPDSRLSDLRKLQRSQAADSVSEVQTIAQSQIDRVAMGEVGTVVGVEGNEAIVELERRADSSVRGRIV